MAKNTRLIEAIENAAAELGMKPSTVGAKAGQGGHFYTRLIEGKRVWPETEASVLRKIENLKLSMADVACGASET